jgi:SAM-dependent methyltransferase
MQQHLNSSGRAAVSKGSRVGRELATIRRRFVSSVYATHNTSAAVAEGLRRCLGTLEKNDRILNVGAGATNVAPGVVNLDQVIHSTVSCCGAAEQLPFREGCFTLVISQETLEHVRDPFRAVTETFRVLKPGGRFYCQVPFVIGYHPGPTDFWRFSREGIRELVEQAGFVCERVDVAVGPGTGFYRIAVEFIAVAAASLHRALYLPLKGVAAVALYPLKWLDRPLSGNPQVNRIAGGYYAISSKPEHVVG